MSIQRTVNAALLSKALQFSTSRSSGPGGQNVNKVNTKVTLKLDIAHAEALTEDERQMLLHKLAPRLTTEGVLVLMSQDKRSQLQNREAVLEKLDKLLSKAFAKKKVRKATKPSKSSVQARIEKKKQHAEKKKWRQKLQ